MKFVMCYSSGKDSALALHKMVAAGHEPVALLTTVNEQKGRSWFHGVPRALLEESAARLRLPLIACKCTPDDYNAAFERGLLEAKALGATACAFGDIDIEEHRVWDSQRCEAAGLACEMPLWQQERETLVAEALSLGIRALIKVVRKDVLDVSLLGQTLDAEIVARIKATGADACGENGEYHTFVYDAPLFTGAVRFTVGQPVDLGRYWALEMA